MLRARKGGGRSAPGSGACPSTWAAPIRLVTWGSSLSGLRLPCWRCPSRALARPVTRPGGDWRPQVARQSVERESVAEEPGHPCVPRLPSGSRSVGDASRLFLLLRPLTLHPFVLGGSQSGFCRRGHLSLSGKTLSIWRESRPATALASRTLPESAVSQRPFQGLTSNAGPSGAACPASQPLLSTLGPHPRVSQGPSWRPGSSSGTPGPRRSGPDPRQDAIARPRSEPDAAPARPVPALRQAPAP